MGWFRRDRNGSATPGVEPGHEAPIEIDLGMQKQFEVEMEVERLKSAGVALYLYAQREVPSIAGIGPMHCRVYVQPGDELRVRAELTSRGFL